MEKRFDFLDVALFMIIAVGLTSFFFANEVKEYYYAKENPLDYAVEKFKFESSVETARGTIEFYNLTSKKIEEISFGDIVVGKNNRMALLPLE